jgi:dihydropteroate synthase
VDDRPGFEIRFADGGVLALGAVTRVMGILNVTPDSFSDGGRHLDPASAVDAAMRMVDEGADLIDVGGESTRPGAAAVGVEAEIARVAGVIEAIRARSTVRISIDTSKAEVARRALDSGADMVNDVSALSDPEMLPLLRETRVPAVLMHMRGDPRTMQRDTAYRDVVAEVAAFLAHAVGRAQDAGIPDGKILVDPGLGFGKSAAGSLTLLKRLPVLARVGRPILVGASRKSFVGDVLDLPVDERLEGSLAVAAFAAAHGAHVIRAHDVRATVHAVRVIDAIRGA